MLFTCALVRSHPNGNEGVKCEIRSVGTNSKILDGPGQTRNAFGNGTPQEAQSKPDRGHEGRICELLLEDGCSSMYEL